MNITIPRVILLNKRDNPPNMIFKMRSKMNPIPSRMYPRRDPAAMSTMTPMMIKIK